MKSFDEFCDCICSRLQEELGEMYETSLRTVRKNNNVTMEGVLIRNKDESVVPTIYLDPYYEQYEEGREIDSMAEEIIKLYRDNRVPEEALPDLDYESIRGKILFRMMNLTRNREALQHMPHIEMGDFAVGFQWMVDFGDKKIGTVRVTDDQTRTWGVTTEELTELARENGERMSPPVVRNIEDVLIELAGEHSPFAEEREERGTDFPMYVLSNKEAHLGASALLAMPFMERFRDRLGEDFWILPSSIHEVILVPQSAAGDRVRLQEMVREINRTQVPEPEFLSDEVYLFSEFVEMMPEMFRKSLQTA